MRPMGGSGQTQVIAIIPATRYGGPARHPGMIKMTARNVGIAILAPIGRFNPLPKGLTQKRRQFLERSELPRIVCIREP